jgi:hypothetical protein
MFVELIDTLFGCRHSHYSFPLTIRASLRSTATAARTGTYVVCLDCGRELNYDWQEMRIERSKRQEIVHSLVTKEAS